MNLKNPTNKPAISLIQVDKSYHQGDLSFPVLRNLSLNIEPNQLVTLMGPSGSGKSTLLNILSAIESADSGEVRIFGHSLRGADEFSLTEYRRKTIGIVFQFFHLLPYLDCIQNVSIPLHLNGVSKSIAEQKAKDILNLVGLGHRLRFTPRELSGGEKQRVSIARAIIHSPKLLLADEPTGNLDSKSSDAIIELFQKCSRELDMTVFLVTHNDEIGRLGDSNYKMKDGNLVT